MNERRAYKITTKWSINKVQTKVPFRYKMVMKAFPLAEIYMDVVRKILRISPIINTGKVALYKII